MRRWRLAAAILAASASGHLHPGLIVAWAVPVANRAALPSPPPPVGRGPSAAYAGLLERMVGHRSRLARRRRIVTMKARTPNWRRSTRPGTPWTHA